ncbi:MAG: hypothetical protein WAN86_04305 [Hyphomicrobiaceae bacterium]
MKTLADFKRLCKEGAQFLRRIFSTTSTGEPVKDRIVTIAYVQTNAIVFVPPPYEATPENIARVKENPHARGSWFHFPKASRCRFDQGEMIVFDQQGRDLIAFKPVCIPET